MSDTLPKLLQEIHSVETPSELNSKLSNFESRIATILSASPDQKNYYVNHTGRELYRKLYNFGLSNLISYSYDSGFRPFLPEWTPADISTQSWYDVSDNSTLTIVSSIVETINDKSGNNLHLTANSTTTNGHTLIPSDLNGLDTVYVDGDDRYNAGSSFSIPGGNLQAFILTKIEIVDNFSDSILAAAGATPNWQLNAASGSQFKAQINSQAGATPASSTDFSGNYHIFNAFFDWDNKLIKSYVDGSSVGSAAYATQLSTSQNLRVYSNRGNSSMPAGKFAEIILCNDVTDATREKIEAYLAHKWGLVPSLPSSHPYKKVSPFIFDV